MWGTSENPFNRCQEDQCTMLWCCTLLCTVTGQETTDKILTMNMEKISQWEWLSPGRGSQKICQVSVGETQIQWTRSWESWSAFRLVLLWVNPALCDLQRSIFPALIISITLWLYSWFYESLFQWTMDSSWWLEDFPESQFLKDLSLVRQNFGKRHVK